MEVRSLGLAHENVKKMLALGGRRARGFPSTLRLMGPSGRLQPWPGQGYRALTTAPTPRSDKTGCQMRCSGNSATCGKAPLCRKSRGGRRKNWRIGLSAGRNATGDAALIAAPKVIGERVKLTLPALIGERAATGEGGTAGAVSNGAKLYA